MTDMENPYKPGTEIHRVWQEIIDKRPEWLAVAVYRLALFGWIVDEPEHLKAVATIIEASHNLEEVH